MIDIISYIKNQDNAVNLVYEFFNGKYQINEVKELLYDTCIFGNKKVRLGTKRLADEFQTVNVDNVNDVEQWYTNTDFYIFDLLPWNSSSMFLNKHRAFIKYMNEFNLKSVCSFGDGLGIGASLYKEQEMDIIYVDLNNSITMQFAKFLFEKFSMNIPVMGDKEFFDSDLFLDVVVSVDCFEHILNLDETIEKIIKHTNVIMHDSTFFSDSITPQHLQNKGDLDFLNMVGKHNLLFRNDPRILWKFHIRYEFKEGTYITSIEYD